MPIYQLTSPTTGQSYRIKADGNLTAQDADFAVAHFDRQYLEANSISPELAAQTPLQTFGNAIPQGFAKVGTAMLGGASAVLDKGSEIVTNLTGLPRVEMFQQGRTLADIMALNAEDTFPTNPLNVKANVVGAGAAQGMSLLAGGAVGKALGASNAALTTAPLVAGGLAGAGEGIRTAEDIGVQSPAAQLAMGVLFGGVEAGTEMIGGFGNKAATEALLSSGRKSAAAMLKEAAKTTVSESGEEMLAGSAQDLLTRAFATEDPSRPGFTKTGVELPKLDRKMLERRGYEALGGMAGGSIFAGAQVLANTALPPPNDSLPPDQTAPAPGAPPSPPGTAPAPGLGASPPPGLEEDLGDLTAEDVADLAPASPPLPLPLTPTPTLPPQTQGVGGGVRGGEGATVQPDTGVGQTMSDPIRASIDEAMRTGRPFTPEEQAYMLGQPPPPQTQTQAPADAVVGQTMSDPFASLLSGTESTRPRNRGETARPQNADPLGELQRAKLAGEANQAQGRLAMPPSPKQWALQLPDESKAAFSEGQMSADHYGDDPYVYRDQWVKPSDLISNLKLEGLTYEQVVRMPSTQQYIELYKQGSLPPPITVVFNIPEGRLKSNNRRRVVAAIEAGITQIPGRVEIGRASELSPNASVTKDSGPTADQTAQVSDPGAGLSPAAGASPSTTEASGISLLRQLNAELPPEAQARWTPEVYAQSERYMQTGNEADLDGLTPIQRKRVINARIDADPDLRKAQEQWDRKMEHKAASIDKRDRAFEQKTTFKPREAEQSRDDAPGFRHLVIDRDLEAGFMSGAGVDALIDLAHRAFAAGRTFAQWAAAMVQRFGAAVRDYLAGVWDHAKRSSQTGALNFTSRLGEQLQRASQQAARPAATAAPLADAIAPPSPAPSALAQQWWASTSRAEARAILQPASLDELKAIIVRMDENPNQSKAKLIDRLVQITGVYADAVGIRGADVIGPRGPMPDYTGQKAAAQQRMREQKAARAQQPKERGLPTKAKPRTPEEFARDMAALMTTPGRQTVGTVQNSATAAPLKAAYASALRGSSTAMIPLADVFAAAQQQNPALTLPQFQAQVLADYESGTVLLEGAGSLQEAQSAGLRIDGTPVGTAVRMMVPQGFKNLDTSGRTAGFLNTDILAEATDLIRNGITDFANWSRAMVQRFGAAIREFLAGIWQQITSPQTNAAQNVRMGRAQGTAPVTLGQGGFVNGPQQPTPNETQSRFASPDPAGRTINGPRADEIVADEATAWLDSVDPQTAVELFHQRAVPLPLDAMEHAAALLLSRLSGQAVSGSSEVQRMWAHTQAQRMGRLWTREFLSADPARALRQRGVVNNTILAPIAPVLAAQEVLTDRAEAAIGPRFEGGTEGVTEKVKEILQQSELDISERVERILQAVMGPRLQPRVSILEAVAGLVNGRTQRQQMIDDVAKALMQRARTRQVTPGQQTALAALVASLKRTLGAAVRGEALKPEAVPMGELLARTFVDQVAEAPLFEEAWNAGRQQVLDMLMETGMTEADARTRLNQLMPATPTVAYAPGMVKQLVKRGFEQAGYGTTLATGSNRTGTRTLDVRTEALRDPAKALNAVLKVWDDAAMEAGISQEAWQGGRQLAINALNETMGQWQQQQAEAQAKAAAAAKASLLAKDSPALQKLLRNLREKIAPGMSWADIFTELPGTQKDRQREIYRRLMLDERLSGLTQDERLALTNELDKAWQRERRKVFINALKREAGLVMRDGVLVKKSVLGEKDKKDIDKVKAATPRLLRLMNLGMLNSDMVREALAEEYGVRQITPAIAAELRALGERIQTAPEGLPRRKLEQQLVEKLQSLVDATLWQTLDSYWTASVLSGWRTQVDIGLSLANGIEDVGLGSVVTAIRTGNKDVAVRALGALFGRIHSAFMEAVDHIATGNKAMMRNFELEAKQAMEGGNRLASDVGAAMWKRGGWRKVPGAFMVFYGRLLTALDHINSSSTREGALAMALARHPELYQRALRITPADRAAARKQARQELTLGTAPANRQQRLEEDARVREILEQGTPPELLDEALEVGRRAALQGDPTGLGGWVMDAVLKAVSVVNMKAEELAGRENADAISKMNARITAALVPFARSLTGTKFIRTVAHAANRNLSYVPGIGAVAVGQEGRTGAFADILVARQIIGTLVGIALYLAFDDDEDEKGIEDSWRNKTPQQKAQLYAQGKQPYSVWGRDAQGRVVSYNYQQWGIAGIMATVAAMHRNKGNPEGTVNALIKSLVEGGMAFADKAQLQGLQTVFGDNYRSTDPASGMASNLNKWAAQTVGGLVPRIAKDIDNELSPELRDTSQWWQRWAKEVPVLRELSSGKRVNILGEDIKLDRGPLSRVRQVGTADPAYRTLGLLNSRDIYLPDPSTGVRIVRLADGTRRPMTPQEKDRYQRLTGQSYRQLLNEKGPQLLQMDPEDAKDYLLKTTKRLRDRAAVQAVK